MSYVIDSHECWICHEPVTNMASAGYVSKAGLALVGHWECLQALNDEIEDREYERKYELLKKRYPAKKASNQ